MTDVGITGSISNSVLCRAYCEVSVEAVCAGFRACWNLLSRCEVVVAGGVKPDCLVDRSVGGEVVRQELSITVPTLFQRSLSLPFHNQMEKK